MKNNLCAENIYKNKKFCNKKNEIIQNENNYIEDFFFKEDNNICTKKLNNFYRERINNFSKEREEYLCELQKIKILFSQFEEMQILNQALQYENNKLKKNESKMQFKIFEEQNKFLKLQQNFENLKLELNDNREKMKILINLVKPKEEIIYFNKKKNNEKKNFFNKNIEYCDKINEKLFDNSSQTDCQIHKNQQNSSIVRLVYLPCDDSKFLFEKVSSLEKQLKKYEEMYESAISDMKQSNEKRYAQTDSEISAKENQIFNLREELKQISHNLGETLQREMKHKKEFYDVEVLYEEEIQNLKKKVEELTEKTKKLSEKIQDGEMAAMKKAEKQMSAKLAIYMEQEKNARLRYCDLKKTFEEAEKQKENEIKNMSQKILKIKREELFMEDRHKEKMNCIYSQMFSIKEKTEVFENALNDFLSNISHQKCSIPRITIHKKCEEIADFIENFFKYQKNLNSFYFFLNSLQNKT